MLRLVVSGGRMPLRDFYYAIRMALRSPGFTAAAVLSFLGISANTAIFTVTDALLLKSLPVEKPEQLETRKSNERAAPAAIIRSVEPACRSQRRVTRQSESMRS